MTGLYLKRPKTGYNVASSRKEMCFIRNHTHKSSHPVGNIKYSVSIWQDSFYFHETGTYCRGQTPFRNTILQAPQGVNNIKKTIPHKADVSGELKDQAKEIGGSIGTKISGNNDNAGGYDSSFGINTQIVLKQLVLKVSVCPYALQG